MEPIQGKGMDMPPDGFLTAAELLHKHGALLICDEVQSGVGRTGKFFAYQHEDVMPDIVTVAKALSGGFVPVGAMLAKGWIFEKVYSSMDRVMVHSTTFKGGDAGDGGRAGHAAGARGREAGGERRPDRRGAARRADRHGRDLRGARRRARTRADDRDRVRQAVLARARTSWNMLQRARVGLFAQMVVVALFQRHRILTQVSGDHIEVIKLIPPLTIGEADVKGFVEAFAEVIDDAGKGSGLMWDFGRTLIKQAVRS